MYYWNEDNFRGLLAVAEAAEARDLSSFAEYCRLREGGQRKPALAALRRFLDDARGRDEAERRAVAAWIVRVALSHPDVHHLNVAPLWSEFVDPTLDRWAAEPEGHLPRRLLALRRCEPDRLHAVLAHDPFDHACRAALIETVLAAVDYAGHHLSEGLFIGDEEEAGAQLREAREHIAALPAGTPREALQRRHDALELLLADWLEFQGTGQHRRRFQEWCTERGRDHGWHRSFYF